MKVVGNLATQFAPPFSLVLHYFIGGFVFHLISMFSLYLYSEGFELSFLSFPYAFLTHLFLLGYVMMIIFGALYQLIPVALEVPIFSFSLGYLQFYLYLTGIIFFTLSLFNVNLSVMLIGAVFVFLSFLIFGFNFFMSVKNLENFSITAKFLISATVSLLIGAFIGVFMVLNFIYGFYAGNIENLVYAHIIFTLFGFVFMVIMGVAIVLLPMFSLSHKFKDSYLKLSFFIMLFAVFGGGVSIILLQNSFIYYTVFLIVVSATVLYLLQVYEIYSKRGRRIRDIGIDTMFASHLFLVVFIVSLLLTPFSERFIFLSGFSFIFGFINFLIYGSMYKILPFLTWFHKFSNLVGKKKVPMLNDMLPKRLPSYQIVISFIGVTLLLAYLLKPLHFIFYIHTTMIVVGSILFIYINIYVLRFKGEE